MTDRILLIVLVYMGGSFLFGVLVGMAIKRARDLDGGD